MENVRRYHGWVVERVSLTLANEMASKIEGRGTVESAKSVAVA